MKHGGIPYTVSLADARTRRQEAKTQLSQGVDPCAQKKAVKAAVKAESANSYEVIALEWFAKYSAGWSESNKVKVLARRVNYGKRNGQSLTLTARSGVYFHIV